MDAWSELLIILALAVVNGLFAMSEIAIVSARRTRLQQRADEGDTGAKAALQLAESPDRFLSTVQVGITLIGILAGVFGGATLAREFNDIFSAAPWLAPYSHALSLTLVVALITFLTLVFGELVPKRLALIAPERIAAVVARPMQGLSRLAAPLVAVLSLSSSLVLRVLRIRPHHEPPVTEEEIKIMMAQGQQAGIFEKAEQDIVERVLRLGDRRVSSIMTPRNDIVWVDIDDSIGESMRAMTAAPHTYFPVCRGSVEQVVGLVSVKDQWIRMVSRQPPDLKATLQPPLFVPESVPALRLLEQFKQAGRHVALVVDEYGSVSGLVTLNDVLEAIVGDVPGSVPPEERDIVLRPDGTWLVDGVVSIDRLLEACGLEPLDPEEREAFDTVAGLLMAKMGRIPSAGDTLTWNNARLEVMDMDGHRVDKVLVARRAVDETAPVGTPSA